MNFICMMFMLQLLKAPDKKIPFEKAKGNGFRQALAPMGEDYINKLQRRL